MPTLNTLLKLLSCCPEIHVPGTKKYEYLRELSIDLSKSLFGENNTCIDNWDSIGKINFPYFEMGAINSTHLFGIDELIIFSYYIFNANSYKKALDIGANIGLHSLILSKLNIQTTSFEPDPIHMTQLNNNLLLNNAEKNITQIQSAVSNNNNQELKFCRVKGNTTGSHLAGAKENPYGELEYFNVNSIDIKDHFEKADLIKLDAEGHEDIILTCLDSKVWKQQDIFVEVGSLKNAGKIFNHFKNTDINLFSQKIGWNKVNNIESMPFSYKEGSLFISKKPLMQWNK